MEKIEATVDGIFSREDAASLKASLAAAVENDEWPLVQELSQRIAELGTADAPVAPEALARLMELDLGKATEIVLQVVELLAAEIAAHPNQGLLHQLVESFHQKVVSRFESYVNAIPQSHYDLDSTRRIFEWLCTYHSELENLMGSDRPPLAPHLSELSCLQPLCEDYEKNVLAQMTVVMERLLEHERESSGRIQRTVSGSVWMWKWADNYTTGFLQSLADKNPVRWRSGPSTTVTGQLLRETETRPVLVKKQGQSRESAERFESCAEAAAWIQSQGQDDSADSTEIEHSETYGLVTPCPRDLFTMINECVTKSNEDGGARLMNAALLACQSLLSDFAERMSNHVESHWHSMPDQYLCAVVNNCDHLGQELCPGLFREASHELGDQMSDSLVANSLADKSATDFFNVAEAALGKIVRRMEKDLIPLFHNAFSDAWFADSSGMAIVVATLVDFFGDMEWGLQEDYCVKLKKLVLDQVVERYKMALSGSNVAVTQKVMQGIAMDMADLRKGGFVSDAALRRKMRTIETVAREKILVEWMWADAGVSDNLLVRAVVGKDPFCLPKVTSRGKSWNEGSPAAIADELRGKSESRRIFVKMGGQRHCEFDSCAKAAAWVEQEVKLFQLD